MSEIYRRYIHGGIILSSELSSPSGLELFGGILWEDHIHDKNTAQFHLFDNDVSWQKVHPVPVPLTPEQKRLQRPSDTREGRRQSEIEAFDRNLEQMRINEIRGELAKI